MLSLIETVLVKIFSILPDADPNSQIVATVNNAFALINPPLAKINLIFPIFVLFKIMLVVIFIELTLFLFTLVMKAITFFKP